MEDTRESHGHNIYTDGDDPMVFKDARFMVHKVLFEYMTCERNFCFQAHVSKKRATMIDSLY
ncbi:hypothetical protein BGW80DRAFT_1402177, partial [Lactifluus volemus]